MRRWSASLLGLHLALVLPGAASGAPPVVATTVVAPTVVAPTNEDCLTCHGDASLARTGGGSVHVPAELWAESVHGKGGLSCTDCHQDLATAELPHAEKLAKVDCSPCHAEAVEVNEKSAHGAVAKLECTSCHNPHAVRHKDEPVANTSHERVANLCLRCHGGHGPGPSTPAAFRDGIHGKTLQGENQGSAPTCVTCHGTHGAFKKSDPQSAVFRNKIPELCGSCHSDVAESYGKGTHGALMHKGDERAPVCTDCHSAHQNLDTRLPAWRLRAVEQCGTCHEKILATYRATYHGKITDLGFTTVATCADCHGAHEILGRDKPGNKLTGEGRVETCRKCHPTATASFAKWDPHADPESPKRSLLVYLVTTSMKGLLAFVFTFFGVHTLLWLPRSYKARKEHEAHRKASKDEEGKP